MAFLRKSSTVHSSTLIESECTTMTADGTKSWKTSVSHLTLTLTVETSVSYEGHYETVLTVLRYDDAGEEISKVNKVRIHTSTDDAKKVHFEVVGEMLSMDDEDIPY